MPRHRRTRVLLVGSEPFGGMSRNPAAEVVEYLNNAATVDAEIVGVVLPVSYDELPGRIAALVAEHQPDVGLGLGLFVGAGYVRIETTAINIADFDVADNQGNFIRNSPLDPRGPDARLATYDAHRLAATLRANGIPSRVSHHAGTHLCNLTLYNLLKVGELKNGYAALGFIHLPLLPEQAADLIESEARQDHMVVRVPVEYPSMGLAMQKAAVQLVVTELVAEIDRSLRSNIELIAARQSL